MSGQWLPVVGWAGLYEVSATGDVRSLARVVEGRPGRFMAKPDRVLKLSRSRDGYLSAHLCRNGVKTSYKVHRLVLAAFVGPCPEGMEACHANGVRDDNRVENLRWDTRSANTLDKVGHGTHPYATRTHCSAGHEYTPENTYTPPNKHERQCITCRTTRKRRYRAQGKDAA